MSKYFYMKIKDKGFTLIEVMIAVVIIGILASIAYPSYIDYIIKSGRSEGVAAVMKVANLQEQYYLDNRAYTTKMTELGFASSPFITEHGYYSVSSDSSGNITATVVTGSSQERDGSCKKISVSAAGEQTPKECWK
ncbi:type IV minor pilin protein PilE [Shewanella sp. M-Br]|jgi:type IV pilus assembly protein PilE|nr:type IV minor pilin protein PilE [Shewanella sp. M-Br]